MRLDVYLESFERSIRNLPGVLGRWTDLPEDLREHYLDEIDLLCASREEAESLAEEEGRHSEVVLILDTYECLLIMFGHQFPNVGLVPNIRPAATQIENRAQGQGEELPLAA